MDERLTRLEDGLRDLRKDFKSLEGKLDERVRSLEEKIDNNFKWIVGLMVGLWLSAVIPMPLQAPRSLLMEVALLRTVDLEPEAELLRRLENTSLIQG